MKKAQSDIKYSLDRFLANIAAGNGTQLIAFVQEIENERIAECGTCFGLFPVKPNKVLKTVDKKCTDHSKLSKLLEDYLDYSCFEEKNRFIKKILLHYDLSDDVIEKASTTWSVNYLRRQNFIREFRLSEGHYFTMTV